MVSSQEEFISEIDKSIETGKSWLWGAYVRAEDGATGWSHFLGDREPTVWGGTLDGIRAMFHLGVPPLSTDLNNAINWMKGQQRPDGGFGSREMDYSSSEATSWVIITLAQVGLDSENDQVVRSAVAYLLKCVDSDGGVATTPLDLDQPRTFPAALALWALSSQPDSTVVRNRIIDRLRSTQDTKSGGWSQRSGAQPNPITTAQVVSALINSGLSTDTTWVRDAAKYVVKHQSETGAWPNSHDEWFTKANPRIPYRTSHFGTAWVLFALSNFDDREYQESGVRGVRYLVTSQAPSGAWIYEEYDPTEQVWCTTQALIALSLWRSRPPNLFRVAGSGRFGPALLIASSAFSKLLSWVRAHLLYIIIALVVLTQFREQISGFFDVLLEFFRIDTKGIWTNLVSSSLWALLILTGGYVLRTLAKERSNANK